MYIDVYICVVYTPTVWTFLTKALELDQQNTGEFDTICSSAVESSPVHLL